MEAAEKKRTRVFISYAWEDAVVAEWLARKLMCCGYSIWIDKLFLRGGRTWPNDIDDAIKNQSFRMVHLLSRHSVNKPNPSKERQLGLTISKERPGFLIPLNLDGITPEALPWQITDVQFIPFEDWRAGFKQLLETLEADNCPRELNRTGSEEAIRTYLPINAVAATPEKLYSNVFKILSYPEKLVHCCAEFKLPRDIAIAAGWPYYELCNGEYVSFWAPPPSLAKYKLEVDGYESVKAEFIKGIKTYNIVKSLLGYSVYEAAKKRGFILDDKNRLVFPKNFGEERFFRFKDFSGKEVRISPHGYTNHGGVHTEYSLSFYPSIITIDEQFFVILTTHIAAFQSDGKLVEPQKRPAICKAITMNWRNRQWFARCSGIVAYLAANTDHFGYGTSTEGEVVISARPVIGESPMSLMDDKISAISKIRYARMSQNEIDMVNNMGSEMEGNQNEE